MARQYDPKNETIILVALLEWRTIHHHQHSVLIYITVILDKLTNCHFKDNFS